MLQHIETQLDELLKRIENLEQHLNFVSTERCEYCNGKGYIKRILTVKCDHYSSNINHG